MVTTMDRPASTLRVGGLDCCIEVFPNREAWLEGRRKGVGASDTAGILGEGYEDQSIVTVWDSKRNAPREIDPRRLKRFNVAKRLEPAMREIFSDETGLPCESIGDFTICRHKDIPWLSATLDGLTEHPEFGPCPVELKDVGIHNRKEWEEDEPPLKFNIQCQHQMLVTGTRHTFLQGLIGRMPVIKVVHRNDRFCDAMLKKLEEFWGYVERGEIPPVDSSAATARILAKLWPKDSGATAVLPPEAADWDRELCEAKEAIKAAEAVKVAAENKLKAAIGEATFGEVTGGCRYSWKQQSRAEHVVKASEFRVLRRCQ